MDAPYDFETTFSSRTKVILSQATKEETPSLERIARLSMQKVSSFKGCGEQTLREIAYALKTYNVKSNYKWEAQRVRKVHRETAKEEAKNLLGRFHRFYK